jgi:hypothetical protein
MLLLPTVNRQPTVSSVEKPVKMLPGVKLTTPVWATTGAVAIASESTEATTALPNDLIMIRTPEAMDMKNRTPAMSQNTCLLFTRHAVS